MIIVALGAGASIGYSVSDWVIQAAPIFISVVTAIAGITNYRAARAALKDPVKIAMARKIEVEANSLQSVLERFDSVIASARPSGPAP